MIALLPVESISPQPRRSASYHSSGWNARTALARLSTALLAAGAGNSYFMMKFATATIRQSLRIVLCTLMFLSVSVCMSGVVLGAPSTAMEAEATALIDSVAESEDNSSSRPNTLPSHVAYHCGCELFGFATFLAGKDQLASAKRVTLDAAGVQILASHVQSQPTKPPRA
ncbi:Hypothetical protein HVPorG_03963 (plasmid) [Roseomonas mucosa]|nr:Hypothetical protein HVPorG_03963 [Roseomonas mucosa]UZO94504.1 Hypothetical protein RMP42_03963 [Roseomonas mucosa]